MDKISGKVRGVQNNPDIFPSQALLLLIHPLFFPLTTRRLLQQSKSLGQTQKSRLTIRIEASKRDFFTTTCAINPLLNK